MIFHKHNWVKITTTYAKPMSAHPIKSMNSFTENMWHGVTTILWECTICHKIRKEELLGEQIQ